MSSSAQPAPLRLGRTIYETKGKALRIYSKPHHKDGF